MDDDGLIPLTLSEIFKRIEARPLMRVRIRVSYLEIYNECVNDLLDPSKKNLDVREQTNKGAVINGLSEFEVDSYNKTMYYLRFGDDQRIIAETKLNELSSRSHTVFRINLEIHERQAEGVSSVKFSQINLVDLAGSEAVSKTKSQGIRLREGQNINRSLLALSNVIYKLS